MKSYSYTVKSPAKINIGLHVLAKRMDGYHDIETIFYPVKIYDELSLKISVSDSPKNNIFIKTEPALLIPPEENLCYKAVQKFFSMYNIPAVYNINISIKKTIPVGGGLGGGSSNAASVLEVLTYHFKNKVSTRYILKRIAMKLGSDIAFFISSKTPASEKALNSLHPLPAYATSRGERLRSLRGYRIGYKILVVCPGIEVPTEWAYTALNLQNPKKAVMSNVTKFDPKRPEIFSNDFEEPVFNKYPVLKEIKQQMYDTGAVFSSMSGSGSCVYGFFADTKIENAHSYFQNKGYAVFKS